MPDYTAESTRCTALTHKGGFCDYVSLPDAPFPICLKHAAMLLRYLNSYAPNGLDDRIITAARSYEQAREVKAERDQRKPPIRGHVYYIRVGDLIKIGHSDNLRSRLGAYPPDAKLLATEIGTRSLEAQRHREFSDALRHRKEWFAPSPGLMAHINALRAAAAA